MARLTKFGTKLGIVGATVYYTVDYGVWTDSSKTEEIYKDLYKLAAPLLKDVPIETPELPKASEISLYAKTCWNRGIVNSAKFISNLPEHTNSLYSQTSQWISSQMGEEPKS